MMALMAASLIAPMTCSLMQHMASSLIIGISWKEVQIAGKKQEHEFLPLLILPLRIKAMFGKVLTRAGKGFNNMDHIDKIF